MSNQGVESGRHGLENIRIGGYAPCTIVGSEVSYFLCLPEGDSMRPVTVENVQNSANGPEHKTIDRLTVVAQIQGLAQIHGTHEPQSILVRQAFPIGFVYLNRDVFAKENLPDGSNEGMNLQIQSLIQDGHTHFVFGSEGQIYPFDPHRDTLICFDQSEKNE